MKTFEKETSLIFENGKIAVVKYKIDEDGDDYIFEEIHEAWETKGILCLSEYGECDVYFNGINVDEIDMSKVIGLKW